jgi:hypothetical protein
LRFFTRSSAVALMQSAGLQVAEVRPHPFRVGGASRVLNALSFGAFRDLLTWQYLIAGVKAGPVRTDPVA